MIPQMEFVLHELNPERQALLVITDEPPPPWATHTLGWKVTFRDPPAQYGYWVYLRAEEITETYTILANHMLKWFHDGLPDNKFRLDAGPPPGEYLR